jgi:hypothetical protein
MSNSTYTHIKEKFNGTQVQQQYFFSLAVMDSAIQVRVRGWVGVKIRGTDRSPNPFSLTFYRRLLTIILTLSLSLFVSLKGDI